MSFTGRDGSRKTENPRHEPGDAAPGLTRPRPLKRWRPANSKPHCAPASPPGVKRRAMATTFGDFEPVIGLEVHAQLLTRTKAFCGCATSFGDPPNTHMCPVCLGLPGSLPVLNARGGAHGGARRRSRSAARSRSSSIFARKNYFYPDLPKGYQISQYDRPLALARRARDRDRRRRKTRASASSACTWKRTPARTSHGIGGDSVVDLNRAGTPLIEIVGEPDLRSSRRGGRVPEAPARGADVPRRQRRQPRAGQLPLRRQRLGPQGRATTKLGTRTELKNINSFRFVAEAIDVEIAPADRAPRAGRARPAADARLQRRQARDVPPPRQGERGRLPLLPRAGSAAARGRRRLRRRRARARSPSSPAARRARFVDELGLTPVRRVGAHRPPARSPLSSRRRARLYRDAGRSVANFVQSEVLRDVAHRRASRRRSRSRRRRSPSCSARRRRARSAASKPRRSTRRWSARDRAPGDDRERARAWP